jgi:hypothetical protein
MPDSTTHTVPAASFFFFWSRLADDRCDKVVDAYGPVSRIYVSSLIVASMPPYLFEPTAAIAKHNNTHSACNRLFFPAGSPTIDATRLSMLKGRSQEFIFRRLLLLACPHSYLSQPPQSPESTTHTACSRLADDRCDNRPRLSMLTGRFQKYIFVAYFC